MIKQIDFGAYFGLSIM